MFKIEVSKKTFADIEKVRRSFSQALVALGNRSEPLKKIKRKQITRWARNFDSQGAIYGAWPALSPTWTIPERLELGYGAGPILVRDGRLRTHFVQQNEAGVVSNQAVVWNMTNGAEAYTVSHHTGYPNPIQARAPIPARPLWDFNDEDEEAAKKILEEWVDRIIGRYFT